MTTETAFWDRREWLPEIDGNWSTAPHLVEGKRCRANRGNCHNPAVAALRRIHGSRGRRWWAYCENHLYGRRLNNGVIEWPYLIGSPAHEEAKRRSDRPTN